MAANRQPRDREGNNISKNIKHHGQAAAAISKVPMTSLGVKSDYGSDIDTHTPIASEYGSEFDAEEETLIGDLLQHITNTAPTEKTIIYPDIRDGDTAEAVVPTVLIHSSPPSAVVRLQRGVAVEPERVERNAPVEVEFNGPARDSQELPLNTSIAEGGETETAQVKSAPAPTNETPQDQTSEIDTRSPLERFRTKPKKPLSVTDLVSPAWCELQYWYTLTKFGRKRRTTAMKQGSKVHKVLEEQVHTFVPIQTQTKEDRFALKLWNTIQGLRTLRATGLTRELEIWGIIDDQLVNGVIDELSYTCPDPALEESLQKSRQQTPGTGLQRQPTIADAFAHAQGEPTASFEVGALESKHKVYIADVKTRGTESVPAGASLRPTWMQLMLYRKLLEALAQNSVDADIIFTRYDLKPLEPFTETFISEIARLDGDGEDAIMSDDATHPVICSTLPASEIAAHGNLSALWSLMISEFSETINNVSDVLRAEFRYARTGDLIASEVFPYDMASIENYVASEMRWWKGEREAVGVEIEEAFKCRSCDFAEECSWRKTKIGEATEKARLRRISRSRSAV